MFQDELANTMAAVVIMERTPATMIWTVQGKYAMVVQNDSLITCVILMLHNH